MFSSYDRLNTEYIPDNTVQYCEHIKLDMPHTPELLLDKNNNIRGYKWNSSERFERTFSVDDIIRVANDAIVYTVSGDGPDVDTEGSREGQQAYNIADGISWTYIGRTETIHLWIQDEKFIYPVHGVKPIPLKEPLTAAQFVKLVVYNFRWEPVFETHSELGDSVVNFKYDDELASVMKSGTYYGVLSICDDVQTRIDKTFYLVVC